MQNTDKKQTPSRASARLAGRVLIGALAFGFGASSAVAQLAEDTFSGYSVGDTLAAPGNIPSLGNGWREDWKTSASEATVTSGGLSYSDGTNSLEVAGDKIRIDASSSGAGNFAQPRRGTSDDLGSSDVWASLLLEMPSDTFFNYRMVGSINDFWIRANNDGSVTLANQAGAAEADFAPSGSFTAGETVMLLMHADRSSGELNAWVNPDLGDDTGPTNADFSSLSNSFNPSNFGHLNLVALQGKRPGSGASDFVVDEVRVSDNFRDVAPIPEPSTYALLGGALAWVAVMLRRRR